MKRMVMPKRRRATLKTEEAAVAVLTEQGYSNVWYGCPQLIADIADRAGYKSMHPLNRSAAVIGALAKSKKFRFLGRHEHLGRKYPVYEMKTETGHE